MGDVHYVKPAVTRVPTKGLIVEIYHATGVRDGAATAAEIVAHVSDMIHFGKPQNPTGIGKPESRRHP